MSQVLSSDVLDGFDCSKGMHMMTKRPLLAAINCFPGSTGRHHQDPKTDLPHSSLKVTMLPANAVLVHCTPPAATSDVQTATRLYPCAHTRPWVAATFVLLRRCALWDHLLVGNRIPVRSGHGPGNKCYRV